MFGLAFVLRVLVTTLLVTTNYLLLVTTHYLLLVTTS